MSPENAYRSIGVIGATIGIGAALSPRHLLAVYGVPSAEVTGAAALGWRLFAMRNLVISAGILGGSREARDVAVGVQALDQVAFLVALRTRGVPRPAALAAMATSGAIIALGLTARSGER